MKAAVLREVGKPLQIEDVKISKPGPREVLIRTAAAGVCHSDLHLVHAPSAPFPLPFTDHRGYRSFNVFTGTGDRTVQRLEKARNGVVNVGLAVGLGVDVAVTSNLFLRGEWQYVHFRDFAGTQASINNLRAAAGLKF